MTKSISKISFPQKPIINLGDTPNQTLSKIDLYITDIHNWLKQTHNIIEPEHYKLKRNIGPAISLPEHKEIS